MPDKTECASMTTVADQVVLPGFSNLQPLPLQITAIDLSKARDLFVAAAECSPTILGIGRPPRLRECISEALNEIDNCICLGAFNGDDLVGALLCVSTENPDELPQLPEFKTADAALTLLHAAIPVRYVTTSAASKLCEGRLACNFRTLHLIAAGTAIAHLGRGICKALVNSAIKYARDIGCQFVRCDTSSAFLSRACQSAGMQLLTELPWPELIPNFIAPYPHHFIKVLLLST